MIRTSSATLFAFAVLTHHAIPLFGASPPRTDIYGDPLPEGVRVRMGTMQLRHADAQATFSADGRKLISCGRRDGLVRHWDVGSGRLLRQIHLCKTPREKKELEGVMLGGRCAALRMKDVVILRDVESGDERGRLTLKAEPKVLEAMPSGDGKFVLVVRDAGEDHKTVELWDVGRGKQIRSGKYEYFSLRIIFSRDGKHAALRTSDEEMRLWDTATGKELRTKATTFEGACFSPDSTTLAVSSLDGTIKLRDVATLKERALLKSPEGRKQPISSLEYSADGRWLAGDNHDGIVIWDVAARSVKYRLPQQHVNELAISPDGKTLVCQGWYWGSELRLWDVAAGKQLHARPEHAKHVNSLAVSPDGKTVASGGYHDPHILLWDTATGRLLRRLQGADSIQECMFSPDGKQIVSSGNESSIQVWDVARATAVRRIKVEGRPYYTFLRLSPDGKYLNAIPVDIDRSTRLTVWDLTTGKQLCQRPYKVDVHRADNPNGSGVMWIETHVAFAPDGQSVTVRRGDHLAIEDVKSGRLLAVLPEKSGSPVTFSPDGQLVAAAVLKPNEDPFEQATMEGIRLIEAATGQEVISIKTGEGPILDYSGDGRLLASIDKESIHIWNVATGDEFFRRPWPDEVRPNPDWSPATTLAFLPDGRGAATGMNDGAILIWDVPTAQQLARSPKRELVEMLWSALAGEPRKAHRAIYALAATPEATLSFFAAHLKPAAAIDAKLTKWLADLDSEQFAVREAAQRELIQHRDDIELALRRFLASKPTLEARKRLEVVLAAPRPVPPAATLRTLRAIRVLEQIGTAEAREQLRKLIGGAAAARQTREAKAALERLIRRRP